MTFPHCPNPDCSNFEAPAGENWYIRYGFHPTSAFGQVQRYRCKNCRRTFSDQTFSIDYYAKKVVDYSKIFEHLVTASGLGDIGRAIDVRIETVQNRFERLARCCQAIHSELLPDLPLQENMAADGLESFSESQYFPHHINIFAGSESEFIYSMGFANLRRKGRMTNDQKKRRLELESIEKADPKAIEKSFINIASELIQLLKDKKITGKTLTTDLHKSYTRAFAKIKDFKKYFLHECISSHEARNKNNPLFPVNYIDRQVRKDNCNHVRETVQFSRCPSAMMMRMTLYRHYHNCMIARRVQDARKNDMTTHVEEAGIARTDLEKIIGKYWMKRPFLRKIKLGTEERKTWFSQWRNPGVKINRYIPLYIRV